MKKYIIFSFLYLLATVAVAQHPFTITGQLAKDKQGIILLEYDNAKGDYIQDSTKVVNGAFTFKGTITDPAYATLNLNPYKGPLTAATMSKIDMQRFYIDGDVNVKSLGGMKEAIITGGKTQAEFTRRNKPFEPLNEQLKPINEKLSRLSKDDSTRMPLMKELGMLMKKADELDSVFIAQHPDSYVAFDIWRRKKARAITPVLNSSFNRFSKSIKESEAGKILSSKIDAVTLLTKGKPAPDFTLPDSEGKMVSLSSFKGKDVLLVFWFRNFVPFDKFALYMRRAEKRLKEKGAVIIGVSYDDEDTWKQQIAEQFPGWVHLNDVEGFSENGRSAGAVTKSYALFNKGTLPAAYLIGKDGKFLSDKVVLNDNELGFTLEKLIENEGK
ncbi:redoxin domain-containing protein [Mucilaginibacter endophyticus]|uniref:redoxin domain-containing protein n=1 Tax=Mucilaginibacter endophyticus TaxID=2675003 RepID=UPI000E0D3800|nr:redoxin domain-containing protein [Mucilaginibacter endophyticus]